MVAALRAPDAARPVDVPRRVRAEPYVVALAVVLPLLTPEIWSGFRLAGSDAVLSMIASSEAPLSWRDPIGDWAVGLVLVWFALAYRSRAYTVWELALVALGGVTVLIRIGNAWIDALAILIPIGRQLAQNRVRLPAIASIVLAIGCIGVAAVLALQHKPPELPSAAVDAARSANTAGAVLTDWHWAPDLERRLGTRHSVLAADGLASEPTHFWLDYVRVELGHERWADILRRWNVDLVVLDPREQGAAAALIRAAGEWHVLADRDDALVAERVQP